MFTVQLNAQQSFENNRWKTFIVSLEIPLGIMKDSNVVG